jgi:hypothetical protein
MTTDHLRVVGSADPRGDELESFLLHSAHAFDEWLLCDCFPIGGDGTAHILTHHFVHIQHVQVNASKLLHVRMAEGFASAHIGFENVAQLLNSILVLKHLHILERKPNTMIIKNK